MSKFITLTVESTDGDVICKDQLTLNVNEIKGFSPIYNELQTTSNGDGSIVWISRSLQMDLLRSLGSFHTSTCPRAWLEVQETPEQILALINN
ncbi:hypothetical protein [Pasteurella multocida]|uniref:hypothetical protein n=1 Tax=Pasteurella multocida TaxID=747 RepID=UPI00148041F0|nr:hypothetical protein [Pasteurella multocida]NNI07701.1 hypothetical protein [Pasteurella multocida]NNI33443.1 hypothetical protein [Pasteurella multocida]